MVRLDIVSWRDGAKIIGAIGQKYIDVNTRFCIDPTNAHDSTSFLGIPSGSLMRDQS